MKALARLWCWWFAKPIEDRYRRTARALADPHPACPLRRTR